MITPGQGIDLLELAYRGKSLKNAPWKSGVFLGETAKAWHSLPSVAKGIVPMTLLDIALSAAVAKPGKAGEGAAGGFGGSAGSLVGSAIGMMALGPAGAIAGGLIGDPIGRHIAESGVRAVVDGTRSLTRLNFGDSYVDTQAALTMRQRGAQELAGSLLNARQWLGKEGALLHQ
jgi:hypothetical protein